MKATLLILFLFASASGERPHSGVTEVVPGLDYDMCTAVAETLNTGLMGTRTQAFCIPQPD